MGHIVTFIISMRHIFIACRLQFIKILLDQSSVGTPSNVLVSEVCLLQ